MEIKTISVIVWAAIFALTEAVIVELNQGPLIGFECNSVLNNTKYYSFLGIPYAKPPLGDLRFQV